MPGGRPRKMTPLRTGAILDGLKLGMTRTAAAGACDIHYKTMARMVDSDVAFSTAVENAEAWAEARFSGIVARAAEEPKNWTAAAWWLERRHWQQYGRRERMELSVDMKGLAAKVAAEDGLDADILIAEAERILAK